MSIPGQTMGVSVFTGHLVDALGMPRLRLSLAYMIGTIASSLILAQAGKFYDRFGARITTMLSGVLMGLVLLFLSRIDHATTGLVKIGLFSFDSWAFILITLAFFLLRFSGQGVMTMVSRSMIMKWFEKRRGMVTAILGIFTSFGFSYAPRVLDGLIQRYEWRSAWQHLALFCGFLFAVVALVLFRDNPKDCGLKPDGFKEIPTRGKIQHREEGENITLKEAKSHPLLWLFSISLAIWAMFNTAFTFHVVSIFKQADWTRSEALAIFFPISVASVLFRFLISWISDRLKLEWIFFIYLVSILLGAASLLLLSQPWVIWLLVTGFGIAGGIFGTLTSVTWVRLFGKKHLGAISGFAMGWIVAGSAVGPYFFSLAERVFGNYFWGSWITLVITMVLIILIFLYSWVKKRESHSV